MEDIEENIEDIVYGSHKFLANLVAKNGLGVYMANVAKERVCSNYFEVDMHLSSLLPSIQLHLYKK